MYLFGSRIPLALANHWLTWLTLCFLMSTTGFVTPINPNEPPKSHVYVFNNIFFSHAVDSQNSFKVVEGDRAAFKGALHELRNLMNVNKVSSVVEWYRTGAMLS